MSGICQVLITTLMTTEATKQSNIETKSWTLSIDGAVGSASRRWRRRAMSRRPSASPWSPVSGRRRPPAVTVPETRERRRFVGITALLYDEFHRCTLTPAINPSINREMIEKQIHAVPVCCSHNDAKAMTSKLVRVAYECQPSWARCK